ncbi:hypothetical protein [Nannocystis pusilla]|uniref:hypothetical protein n=1 Tax=Nannocystis pusilla TaxID=889268 RepID=UPI003B768D92
MHKHTVSVSAGAFALALLLPAAGRADLPPVRRQSPSQPRRPPPPRRRRPTSRSPTRRR